MKTRRGIACAGVLLMLVAANCYYSAYLTLVQRVPVYYGNRLHQLRAPIGISVPPIDAGSAPAPTFAPGNRQLTMDDPPDSYRPAYLLSNPQWERFFRPAHWLDSKLRPNYWPPYDATRQSC